MTKLTDRSNNFKKDYKLLAKRNKDLDKLRHVIDLLVNDLPLPAKCNPHKLKGEYSGFWECHIEPDWLLIYTFDKNSLYLHRTGRHQDLFEKY
jgi:mRNA interferase YafQ